MEKKPRRYSSSFRQDALERLQVCGNVRALAKELGVSHTTLYLWRRKETGSPSRPKGSRTRKPLGEIRDVEARTIMLEREAASRTLQDGRFTNDKLKKSGLGAGKGKSDSA